MNAASPISIPFTMRPASTAWELMMLTGVPVPVWFRPQQLPQGALIQLSPEVLAKVPDRKLLTLQSLLAGVGATPAELAAVSLYGGQWMPAQVALQILNHPLPDPPPGAPTQMSLLLQSAVPAMPMPPAAASPAMAVPQSAQPMGMTDAAVPADHAPAELDLNSLPAEPKQLRDRIEADWNSCLQLERQIAALRQKLSASLSKLGTLDRDLTSQERLAADRNDVDAWQDARRWLRDASAKLHRFIKAHDVGVTSAAGKRNVMEQMYERSTTGMLSAPETAELYREMESWRRLMSQLQSNMHNALSTATQDGEGRARRVLQRIKAKEQTQRRQWRSGK